MSVIVGVGEEGLLTFSKYALYKMNAMCLRVFENKQHLNKQTSKVSDLYTISIFTGNSRGPQA